ncbi:MAG TPA: NAD(P)/FAD-dependent oxidoreductase [Myxococcota bacterium]|nr:NAD(P)/FAD-dependent oxidoreductase [Myxococcota bacterium]
MKSVDVAIVGGGPAGLSCAIEFAQLGFTVTVIEPQAPIIEKPCGEGIMPLGVMHLRRLKVFRHLDPNNMSPFLGLCLINEQGVSVKSNFAKSYGLGCRRENLSQALYARVREFENISLLPALALGLTKTSEAIQIETEKGLVRARLAVGADGLRSFIRRKAGLLGNETKNKRYGLRKHFRVKPWSQHVEVHFRPGIEAYITPCGPWQTNVAFLWSKEELTLSKISFDAMIEYFPNIKAKICGSEALSEQMAIGPLEQKCKSPIADGLALVGDASGYLDAITGEGNSIAFAQSYALATIASSALKALRGPLNKEQLQPYAKAHRQIVSSYYRNTKIMLWLRKRPLLMSMLIKAGSFCPQLFSLAIEGARTA